MRHIKVFCRTLLFCTALALCAGACTAATAHAAMQAVPSLDDDEHYLDDVGPVVADPLEPWNRAMHSFNDVLLDTVARPAYRGYAYVTPRFLRTGIRNAFHNLLFPVRFVNNLLQGKGRAAGVEMSSFILNSTAGLGGFFDVASHHKPVVAVDDSEDFGQTLGVWGLGEGFYIVWPVLGPSSARDSVGMVGDYFLDPLSYVSPDLLALGLQGARSFNKLDEVLDQYDSINNIAVEPYSSFRNAYIQHRRALLEK